MEKLKKETRLSNTIKEFYKVYSIQPLHKQGDKYYTGQLRFAEVIAEEDIYPELYDYTYIKLLAYLSRHQEYEQFEIASCNEDCVKETILEWYLRNKSLVNPKHVNMIVRAPRYSLESLDSCMI